MKEKVPRQVKMARIADGWLYNRFGVGEKPVQMVREQMNLLDEGQMKRGWIYDRFGVEER